ncbi:MAG: glycerophosphodiester phosphodiesterase family protein [Deltaproteobacteria bacterium]|nr:glycerophosphodiester phosphodiesterase family protein [Deltaproteobacteria bacterium]
MSVGGSLLLFSLLLSPSLGCTSNAADDDEAGDEVSDAIDAEHVSDGRERPAEEEVSVPPNPIAPERYDCTAHDDPPPDRTSPIAWDCLLDPTCRERFIVGHRGAGGDFGVVAPENSLAAFRAAILMAADYLETDPRVTTDGEVILFHDPEVDRVMNGTGSIGTMTFAQVRALSFQTDKYEGDFSCERIPTLREAIALSRDRSILMLDMNKTDDVEAVVAVIQEEDAVDQVIFDTSSLDKIDRALALEPGLAIQIRPDTAADIASQVEHFAPRIPTIVELEAGILEEGAPIVHALPSRVTIDVFLSADLRAVFLGDVAAYVTWYDDGADMLMTERPYLAAIALGRL